jgi:hypothetical protein
MLQRERESSLAEQLAAALEPYLTIPGRGTLEAWTEVMLALEEEPGGVSYRAHRIQWVAAAAPGEWLHEVDGNGEWSFASLAAALTFIDALES